jgi:sugar phosphate isomerase/epimerase
VLKKVNHPYIRACVDVGHTRLYSETPFKTWLDVMSPYLVHVHLNNNDGLNDSHRGLGTGVVEYPGILSMLRALPNPPSMTLEMDLVAEMASSLPYFSLVRQPQRD